MKRVVIANFYPVWPVVGGGQRRIFFLARELSKAFDVEIVVPERQGFSKTLQFSHTLRQTHVAVETRFGTLERRLDSEVKSAADVAYTMYWNECHHYQSVLADRIASADAVVTAHPYSIRSVLEARGGHSVPVVFDSQNVEGRGKASVLEGYDSYLAEVRAIEREALRDSDRIFACSESDSAAFTEDYGIPSDKITIIENGVDALGVPSVSADIRDRLRSDLSLSNRLVAVFGGSYHYPNFQAARRTIDLAKATPEIAYIFLGGVCNHEDLKTCNAENIVCLGEVDESSKWMVFNMADIGLNPMELGSGSNIKMFEYAAAGLTCLSTQFGARGIGLEPVEEYLLAEVDQMAPLLNSFNAKSRDRLMDIGLRGKNKVTAIADWSVIGKRYINSFQSITSPKSE